MSDNEILEKHKDEKAKFLKYTRVMGYYRPVSSFNTGKTGEFNERVMFTSPGCSCCKD